MGTYDTRGGAPISPRDDEPPISPLQEVILELLEDAGFDSETNDKIIDLIAAAELKKAREEDAASDLAAPDAEDNQPCDPLYGQRMDSADMGEN